MATSPKVRQIAETLTNAQIDPRLTKIICDIAERQRHQHQQIYEYAKLFVAMQEVLNTVLKKLAIRDGNLEKLGVKEMLTNFQGKNEGALVQSVEEFDTEESAHSLDPGRKN